MPTSFLSSQDSSKKAETALYNEAIMTLPLILLWSTVVALFAVGGAYYARRYEKADALIALYVTLVIASNLVAAKVVEFDLLVWSAFAPAATLIFSATFLLLDIVNEKFGRAEAQRMIFIAVVAQIAFLLFAFMAVRATPAPFFELQSAFEAVFANAPRIAAAGLVTFFISEMLDAYLFAWLRSLTGGKHLWLRNVFSSMPAMALDSALFVTLAFWGIAPLLPLIVGLTVVKWVVGVIDIPFMYLARAVLRRG